MKLSMISCGNPEMRNFRVSMLYDHHYMLLGSGCIFYAVKKGSRIKPVYDSRINEGNWAKLEGDVTDMYDIYTLGSHLLTTEEHDRLDRFREKGYGNDFIMHKRLY